MVAGELPANDRVVGAEEAHAAVCVVDYLHQAVGALGAVEDLDAGGELATGQHRREDRHEKRREGRGPLPRRKGHGAEEDQERGGAKEDVVGLERGDETEGGEEGAEEAACGRDRVDGPHAVAGRAEVVRRQADGDRADHPESDETGGEEKGPAEEGTAAGPEARGEAKEQAGGHRREAKEDAAGHDDEAQETGGGRAIGEDAAGVVARPPGRQGHGEEGGPDEEADAEDGTDDAGAEDLDDHDAGASAEDGRDQLWMAQASGGGFGTRIGGCRMSAGGPLLVTMLPGHRRHVRRRPRTWPATRRGSSMTQCERALPRPRHSARSRNPFCGRVFAEAEPSARLERREHLGLPSRMAWTPDRPEMVPASQTGSPGRAWAEADGQPGTCGERGRRGQAAASPDASFGGGEPAEGGPPR